MASTPYKHFVPPVPLNPDYDKNLTYVLIESLEQLKDSFKKGYVIAWDTETTGLNPTESEIVGFSYTYDGITGYYCPVKHFDLALGKPALDLFYQSLKDSKLQLLYNARFDIRMMEYSGYDMSFMYPKDPKTNSSNALFIDVMNQVWLSDTNIPLPSLKSSTLHFLGYQPPKFLETLGDEQNFQYVPSKDAYRYACFTKDTEVQTKHGLKQISELKPQQDLIKTSVGYKRLLSVLDQGIQQVIKVTTPIGTSFTCTPDHKFAIELEQTLYWVQAKDLDKVPFYSLYRGGKSLNEVVEEINPEIKIEPRKACEIEYLDEPQPVFDLTIEDEHNFFLQCGIIAHNCLDAINTYNLFKVTYKYYKESGLAAKMDNACVYIMGQLEKTPLKINTEYLIGLRDNVYNRVLELEQEIYSLAGHQFKIGSNRELTQVFLEQGIDTGERTKAGDMKTGIELLNLYLRNHPDCTLLNLLIEYKEQFKFYNSYLKTLVDIAKQQETVPPRFSYKLQSVPCLTENNLVLVKDKGIVHIPQVEENDLIWTQYGYKRVLWCNSHKSKDIYRVIFDNALFIEGTSHHPVLVNKGDEIDIKLEWATLESLNVGEKVIFNHHTPTMGYSNDPKDQEYTKYLEYLGFLSSIYIEPNAKYLPDYIQTKFELEEKSSQEFQKLTSILTGSIDNLMELVVHSQPYQWVSFIQGILYGVFETEVAQQWNTKPIERFIIRSKQPVFLTLIMNLLFYLGIPNTLCYDEDSYYLELSSIQSLTLFNIFIVSDSDSQYLKSYFYSYNTSGYYPEYADSQVKHIERLAGEQTVYDIEVEDVHEYVANGIVTHNTGRYACGKDGKNTYFAPINLQCLNEDTRVITSKGMEVIRNIKTGDLIWDGEQFTFCEQLGSKRKELFRVSCGNNHYLEASKEHQVYAYHGNTVGWYKLGELIEGDYLAINRKYGDKEDVIVTAHFGQINRLNGGVKRQEIHVKEPLLDFWFFCGYFVGDGCFIKDRSSFRGIYLAVPNNKEDANSRLLSGLLEVGIKPYECLNKKDKYEDIPALVTKSIALSDFLLSLGFKHGAENKVIPEVIFTLSPRQKFAFIDGLVSSDGHVGSSIEYKTVSKRLAESFRDLLESLGYYSTYSGSREKGYTVIIQDKLRFKDEIGLTVKYKHNKIRGYQRRFGIPCDLYKHYKSIKEYKDKIISSDIDHLYSLGIEEAKFAFKKIDSIEYIGEKTVYDLFVPSTNRFVANGFIVHNSLPKPKSIKCYGRKATEEEIEQNKDTLGWIFSPDYPEWSPGLVVEGMNQYLNVRAAFQPEHPENGDYVVSIDMSGEELRVVTNLFKEHNWAKVINAGGDLHHANSDAIFGPENYTKETRKRSKGAAFGMLYGQEYRGFQRKFPDMSLDEAKEFMIKFKRTIPSIVRGQERMIKEARRTGTFYSGFGRPRRVKHYLASSDYKDVAFGERTIKNGPIQGTAADVLKLEFIRLWDNIFTQFPEIKFICTIHDEINFSVPRKLANKVIPMMIRCMTVKMPDWIVTLDCSLSAGPTLGEQYPFKYNFETKEFIPDWEEDKRKESNKEEEKQEIENPEVEDIEYEEINEGSDSDNSIEEIDSKMFDF
jgi:DNA polymerase I-like protein with 3'-5' exonuclease and polymerase domains